MNIYQRSSIMERYAFLEYFAIPNAAISDLSFTNGYGGYSYDFSCTSGTTASYQVIYTGEIKVRNYWLDENPTWILEDAKLQALNKLEKQLLYVNFFYDGYVIWKLDDDLVSSLKRDRYKGKNIWHLEVSKAIEHKSLKIDYGSLLNKAIDYGRKFKKYNPDEFVLKRI